MESLQASLPFQLYVFAAAFTVVKLVVIAFATAGVRAASKTSTLPEDAKLGNTVVEAETAKVARLQRVHRNALENEVPFLVLGLLYVLAGASARGAAVYFAVFVGARLLHSAFFTLKLQPWRSLSFAVGAFALLGMSVGSCLLVIG